MKVGVRTYVEHVVIAKIMQNLKDYAARHPIVFKPPFQGSIALKELKQIFTIDPVDRAAHNMALICKRWYLFTLSHELSTKADKGPLAISSGISFGIWTKIAEVASFVDHQSS